MTRLMFSLPRYFVFYSSLHHSIGLPRTLGGRGCLGLNIMLSSRSLVGSRALGVALLPGARGRHDLIGKLDELLWPNGYRVVSVWLYG